MVLGQTITKTLRIENSQATDNIMVKESESAECQTQSGTEEKKSRYTSGWEPQRDTREQLRPEKSSIPHVCALFSLTLMGEIQRPQEKKRHKVSTQMQLSSVHKEHKPLEIMRNNQKIHFCSSSIHPSSDRMVADVGS